MPNPNESVTSPNPTDGGTPAVEAPKARTLGDVFTSVPEAVAARSADPPSEVIEPGPAKIDAAPGEVAGEAGETGKTDEKDTPPETEVVPEDRPAWFAEAMKQERDRWEAEVLAPVREELHSLKSEAGRELKTEEEQLISEAEAHTNRFKEQIEQVNSKLGTEFLNLFVDLQQAQRDERGNVMIPDNDGNLQPMNPAYVGSLLLNAISVNQGMANNYGQSYQGITTKVEAVIFKRHPEYTEYKPQFDQKAAQIYGADQVGSIKTDPNRVGVVYEALHNAAVAKGLDKVKAENLAALRNEKARANKAKAPTTGGGRAVPADTTSRTEAEKRAAASLGLTRRFNPMGPRTEIVQND